MFLTRFHPFGGQTGSVAQHFNRLQNEFERLWGNDRFVWGQRTFPAVNVWEQDETLHLEAELPGLELNDLEIFVTGQNQLTIKGERKLPAPEKATQHRQERAYGNFVRTLTLPFPVDDSKVEARLENGILKVRLPKHEAARPRKITVQG